MLGKVIFFCNSGPEEGKTNKKCSITLDRRTNVKGSIQKKNTFAKEGHKGKEGRLTGL